MSCFLQKMMNIFSGRSVIRPQFCGKVLLGPHQMKSGVYMTFNIHALCDIAGRRHVAWYMVMLYMWPPCQWSEISFSVPQCFLLLKSISSTQIVFTQQPTGSLTCPAEQFASVISWKCLPQTSMVFHQTLRRPLIPCRGCLSYENVVSDFCHMPSGQEETLLTFCRGVGQWDPENYRLTDP